MRVQVSKKSKDDDSDTPAAGDVSSLEDPSSGTPHNAARSARGYPAEQAELIPKGESLATRARAGRLAAMHSGS